MGMLAQVRTAAKRLPPRTFLYAREKFGKSSFAAQAPKPIFFMTRGETGLLELIDAGRLKPTPHFPYDDRQPPTWETLLQAVDELISDKHDFETFVIDTNNGAEILCTDHVRRTEFQNSQAKFASYGKGMVACRIHWSHFLAKLDHLRSSRGMGITLLAHTKRAKFNDPTGEDFDKYMPECQEKLWDLTHKWADIICHGLFENEKYETEDGKIKAKNAVQKRKLCFDPSPLWDAGNRYGLTGMLDVSGGAERAYQSFAAALDKARGQAQTVAQPSGPPRPTQAEFEATIAKKGRSPKTFAEWCAKAHPTLDLSTTGFDGIPDAVLLGYLAGVAKLPDTGNISTAAGDHLGLLLRAINAAGLTWPAIRGEHGAALKLPENCKPTDLTPEQCNILVARITTPPAEASTDEVEGEFAEEGVAAGGAQ